MSRVKKFRAYGHLAGQDYQMFHNVYEFDIFDGELIPVWEEEVICDHTLIQYTGLKDKNGVEIYDQDILNICFTSGGGESIHDGIYVASKTILGGLKFEFKRLMWVSYGYNQFPLSNELCERYGSLDVLYSNDRQNLIVKDEYTAYPENDYPFNNEKEISFCSRYFEVIGNIHSNPELLESTK